MKAPKNVTLIKAEYYNDYKYKFIFSNGKKHIVDFRRIVTFHCNKKYLDITKFRKMKISNEHGVIYWGNNWDICFNINAYYGEKYIKPIQ